MPFKHCHVYSWCDQAKLHTLFSRDCPVRLTSAYTNKERGLSQTLGAE